MRKFQKPFDEYEVTTISPIEISLLRNSINKYRELYDNPLYYYYGFQYSSSGFFRSVLGYETLWDKKVEDSLTEYLDDYIYHCKLERLYYIEDYIFTADAVIQGALWYRGVKPKSLKLFGYENNKCRFIKAGTKVTARVNHLDSPAHVDLEFHETGEIITIYLKRFETLKEYAVKRYETNPSLKRGSSKKDAASRTNNTPEDNLRRFLPKEVASELLRLRKRVRRANSL